MKDTNRKEKPNFNRVAYSFAPGGDGQWYVYKIQFDPILNLAGETTRLTEQPCEDKAEAYERFKIVVAQEM